MSQASQTRRRFLQTSAATAAAGLTAPYWFSGALAQAAEGDSKNDRHVIGCIGVGARWKGLHRGAMPFGDIVAVCDVDSKHAETANGLVGGKAEMYGDYRKL